MSGTEGSQLPYLGAEDLDDDDLVVAVVDVSDDTMSANGSNVHTTLGDVAEFVTPGLRFVADTPWGLPGIDNAGDGSEGWVTFAANEFGGGVGCGFGAEWPHSYFWVDATETWSMLDLFNAPVEPEGVGGEVMLGTYDETAYIWIGGGAGQNDTFISATRDMEMMWGVSGDGQTYAVTPVDVETTDEYTAIPAPQASSGDVGRVKVISHATAATVTLPAGAPVGVTLTFMQGSTGALTFVDDGDSTVTAGPAGSLTTAGEGAIVQALCYAADTWRVFGELADAP